MPKLYNEIDMKNMEIEELKASIRELRRQTDGLLNAAFIKNIKIDNLKQQIEQAKLVIHHLSKK